MSVPLVPKSPRRLLVACALLLGLILSAARLESRSPGMLPLLAVAGCLVFHWYGHGGRPTLGVGDKSEPHQRTHW